jgi:tetratricopeptide (TPR) repeat protein
MNPFRERQALRWQEAERRRIAAAPTTDRTRQRLPMRLWRHGASVWKGIVAAVISLSATASIILVVAVFIDSLVGRTISVQPLSVPRPVAEAGFTAEVAALRLRDAINNLAAQAKTSMPHREIMQQADILDVVVPTVGLSVQTLAAEVRTFLGIKRRQNISGEFAVGSGSIYLTLRLDGEPFFTSPKGADRERPVDLLAEGAGAALRATQPYIFAVLVYDSDKSLSFSIAETIIATSPKRSLEVGYAHILRGAVLGDLGRGDEAMAEYKVAIALDPKYAYPHHGLGNVLSDLGRGDEAMAEYKVAIALDPKYAYPHVGLGNVLSDLGRRDEAMAEYKAAVALDPTIAAQTPLAD